MEKRRADYTAPSCRVEAVSLDIRIFDTEAIVSTTMELERVSGEPFLLNGRDIELLELHMDGAQIPREEWPTGEMGLTLTDLPERCVLKVVSRCRPQTNTALEGLYLSGGMYCTQCEPEGFRRMAFYPDRPDVMSVFTVRIEADRKFPNLLSNGNLVEKGDVGDDRHFALWRDPHPKPSYLFACVAGDLELVEDDFRTASGRNVALHIYVEKGNASLTGHAMESLKRAMKWDEDTFGLEYDLDLFQIVAVSHFNMGAMENKGLNIFNSKFVLADPGTATDDDLDRVESIVAHEYFHNWTGNRVTCRDWFQLTLKEGLTVFRDQSFSADMHDDGVQRAGDVGALRAMQFPEDRSPNAHPIRPESYREINNFYTPTVYEKGAEVIRMMAGYLGRDGFRRGMDKYFERHDGRAVTCDDFVAALADANGRDMSSFSRWYEQAGTPVLSIKRGGGGTGKGADTGKNKGKDGDRDAGISLAMAQQLPTTSAGTPRKPMPLPVRLGFVGSDGGPVKTRLAEENEAREEHVVLLDEASRTFTFVREGGGAGDATPVPSLLRGFSAPVDISDDLTPDERLHLMASDSDSFNRWDQAQRLATDAIVAIAAGEAAPVDRLAAAYDRIVGDEGLLAEYRAFILGMPSMAVVESASKPADPPALFAARQKLVGALGAALASRIEAGLGDSLKMQRSAGGRALLVRFMSLGAAAGDEKVIKTAESMVGHDNMTLSQGALAALVHCDHEARRRGLDAFYKRWRDDQLVIEKWFQMEAMSSVSGDVRRLGELMRDACFDENSPNKIRSVLGAFMAGNTVRFHAEDGSGYRFVAERIVEIDSRNGQLAARLCLPLTRTVNYGEQRRTQMRKALVVLRDGATSNDLKEIVGKALAASQ